MGGKTETVMVCRTEAERVHAMEEYFGISLTAEEKDGVRGRNVDLNAQLLQCVWHESQKLQRTIKITFRLSVLLSLND